MRRLVALILLLVALAAPPSLAEKRVALVIGNDVYANMDLEVIHAGNCPTVQHCFLCA